MKRLHLTTPCAHCPFRSDVPGFLRRTRAREVARDIQRGGEFVCHKTTVYDEERERMMRTRRSLSCAGSLILMEKSGSGPNQSARVMERLGLYDPDSLDMDAPVFASFAAFIKHHSE